MSHNNKSLIKYIEELARLKKIKSDNLIEILIEVIKEVWALRYENSSLEVVYDKENNDLLFFQNLLVVDDKKRHDPLFEIPLKIAKRKRPSVEINETLQEECNPEILFSRVMIDEIRKELNKKTFVFLRNEEYDKFVQLKETVQHGIVKGSAGRNLIIDIDGTDVLLLKSEQVMKEKLYKGEKVYVYICDVEKKYFPNEHQVTCSRKDPALVSQMLKIFVPEVDDKIIVKRVARLAGYKTKIALDTLDENINPVSMAIGYKGSRIKALRKEIFGEKVEFFKWSDNLEIFIKNALGNIQIDNIHFDYNRNELKIAVEDSSIDAAIGLEGKNSRLLSMLLPKRIDKISMIPTSKFQLMTYNIMDILNLSQEICALLETSDLGSINKINRCSINDLAEKLPSLDMDILQEIMERIEVLVDYEKKEFQNNFPESDIFMAYNLDPIHCNILAKNDLDTLEKLQKASLNELVSLLSNSMHKKDIVDLHMDMGQQNNNF